MFRFSHFLFVFSSKDGPSVEDLKKEDVEEEALIDFLNRENFKSLIERFQREQEAIKNGSFFRKEWNPRYIPPEEFDTYIPAGVTAVRDIESAKAILPKLLKLTDRIHACDTETVEVNLKKSPIGQGKIICFSIYCGSDLDFGNGPRVWVDTMGECEGLLEIFEPYFTNENIKKIWHNYSFDKAVLANSGIHCKGFGGDTMQMARLWDTSRIWKGGYSLQGLSNDLLSEDDDKKRGMMQRFGSYNRRRDGSLGKIVAMPELSELQRNPDFISEWIDYSTLDTEATWKLYQDLAQRLSLMEWAPKEGIKSNMFEFYKQDWVPFGELLTEIEAEGIKVNVPFLKVQQKAAEEDYRNKTQFFKDWASKYCPDAKYMNTDSDLQKQQLFFAPMKNKKTREKSPKEKTFRRENVEGFIEEGKKIPKKTQPFTISGFGWKSKIYTKSGWAAANTANLRWLCGNPDKGQYGTAMNYFKSEENGIKACQVTL